MSLAPISRPVGLFAFPVDPDSLEERAQSEVTSPAVLERLAIYNQNISVYGRAWRNPQLPSSARSVLLDWVEQAPTDGSGGEARERRLNLMVWGLLENPSTTTADLSRLYAATGERYRVKISRHPACPEQLKTVDPQPAEVKVRRNVAVKVYGSR